MDRSKREVCGRVEGFYDDDAGIETENVLGVENDVYEVERVVDMKWKKVRHGPLVETEQNG